MVALDQAIEEGIYLTSDKTLADQTWKDFEDAASAGILWIFGAGEGAGVFFEKYGDRFPIIGILDNAPDKDGCPAKSFIAKEVLPQEALELMVTLPEKTEGWKQEKAVVLVTSVRYSYEIVTQLRNSGVIHIFSLLHMEANNRLCGLNENVKRGLNEISRRAIYARECISRPINHHKIILAREEYGGHGKQILLRLLEMRSDLDLVWITDRGDILAPEGIRLVNQKDWKSYIYELETAKIWMFGDVIPEYAVKREEQIYIQLKHWGSLTLKKFYLDLHRQLEGSKVAAEQYRLNSDVMDYIFVGSDIDESSCRSGFDFHGECIRVGSPRTDVLFQECVRERVRAHLGIDSQKKVLIYAPTFRAINENSLTGRMKEVDIDFEALKKALEDRFGNEWFIFLRIHPYVAVESHKVVRPDFVIDVSHYPDGQELMAASDITISDYSSILFEHAYVKKPVFLYAPDMEQYVGKERELLLDYKSLPFPLAKSNMELEQVIADFDETIYLRDLNAFLDRYGVREDGHAAERAAKFVNSLMDNEDVSYE